ncbi:MAG: metal ABC transporter ATP-binding protein [Gemmatimonadetes bacterium]|nr:metal ABC transporter ATP-binding protein [Gemmatimonadota bacterium]
MRSGAEGGRPLIAFEDVTLGYYGVAVLSGLSFSIREGDFLGMVGPNGAGKTTILRAVLGALRPLAGRVTVHDEWVRFGYVPQRQSLDAGWPLKTLDVVGMGAYDRVGVFRRPGAPVREAALQALDHVGIRELADQPFGSLSGGQKQRALIARALVGRPTMLVLDEPTDGMDLVSSTSILELVRELHDRDRLTVLMVSHQLNEVANYVRQLALVLEGAFQIGETEEILTSENLSALYGIPVQVDQVNGQRMVLPREVPELGGPADKAIAAVGSAGRPDAATRSRGDAEALSAGMGPPPPGVGPASKDAPARSSGTGPGPGTARGEGDRA